MLRNTGLSVLFVFAALSPAAAERGYQVRPDGIVAGNARFQPLSDNLIRMEYSETGVFTDAPTAVVANRLKPVRAKVSDDGTWLTIATPGYRLRYKLNAGAFTANDLLVSWKGRSWVPGQLDLRNLGATAVSLDGADTGNLPPLGQGLLSRSGYWLLDDSATPLIDPGTKWITEKTRPWSTDEYLFIYRDDFKGALKEYTRLLGPVPLIPRYALGCWYSRYWDYTDAELKEVVEGFRSRNIPLDVLVVDVDWHKYGWEGYDWNTKSFPDPQAFLNWCHGNGLEVTLNNHPSEVVAEDSHAGPVRQMLGLPAANEGFHFNLAIQKQAQAYNEILHDPLVDPGVSFWWIDGDDAYLPGLDSRLWTNRVYYTHQEAHTGKRSLIFSRYGGTGSHRYPLGFSGDTIAGWAVLRYETGMTPVAGNVLWQWSHDIGGFHGNKDDEELMARWTQFGAFAPVLRLHSNHGERRPWAYEPRTEKVMAEAMRLRESLIPYVYSLQHALSAESIPVYRALYVDDPRDAQAYQHPYQYSVGSDLLVAPASAPTNGGQTEVPVYLPKGKWMDYFTGRPYDGDRSFVFPAALKDIPLFAKAGAIIPTQVAKQWDAQPGTDQTVTLRVYRGASGTFTMTQDDGVSLDYREGKVATTRLSLRDSLDGFTFTVGPRVGSYAGAPAERSFDLLVFGVTQPRSVTVNGVSQTCKVGADGLLRVRLGLRLAREAIEVKVDNPGGLASFSFKMRARAIIRRLTALMPGLIGANAEKAIDTAAAKLDADVRQVESGERAPYDLGRVLLGLATAVQKLRGSDDLLAKILDFRCSGEVDRAQPFGFVDTLSACASWDQNLPQAGVRAELVAPKGFDVKRVSPPALDFDRWALKESQQSSIGDFEATLTWTAALPGHPIAKTQRLKWSNAFVTQWKFLGPFQGMKPASDEALFEDGKQIDFAKSFQSFDGPAKWIDMPGRMSVWGVMSPRFIDLSKIWNREEVHGYAATYLYSPDDREVRLEVGSDDTVVAWVNRREVDRFDDPRPAAPGQDKVTVGLKKGWNEVVLRIGNGGGGWGFYLEVKKPDGRAESAVRVSTVPR